MSARTDRNERFFGSEGQTAIGNVTVVIVGLGGLGSHVAQQLAYLGVQNYRLVDHDVVTESGLNRLIGARPQDAQARRLKVLVAKRQIRRIQPDASVQVFPNVVDDERSVTAFLGSDIAIGSVDNEPARLRLLEITMRERIPYLDLATEIDPEPPAYGGRIFFSRPGVRCLSCDRELDQEELRVASMGPEERAAHERTYGLKPGSLVQTGPAVVSINGVVASLGVTEFMMWATGLREPFEHLVYLGHEGVVRRRADQPASSCFYCRHEN
jgi:hypothetical protein